VKARAKEAQRELDGWLDRLDLSRLRTNRSMQGDWTLRTLTADGDAAVSGSFKLGVGLSFDDYDLFRAGCVRHICALREPPGDEGRP
jgi:hypothetical protein